MRLTVVPSDKIIIKDGKEYNVSDLSYIDSNIHAIQWYDDKGEIEYVDGTSNLAITDITPYNQCVTDWEAEKTKEAEANVYTAEQWEKWFRDIRNELLTDSDWTQLSDNQLTDSKKTEWQTYRQALRDMPTTKTGTYEELVLNLGHSDYPTKPS